MNTPGQNSNAVAELALGMMVYMARNSSNWNWFRTERQKAGNPPYGNVGRQVARIARGFGMEVLAFDPFITSESMQQEGITPVKSVQDRTKNAPTYPCTSRPPKKPGNPLDRNF
jgi:D-3-phosphoglycerate dehydrogenase